MVTDITPLNTYKVTFENAAMEETYVKAFGFRALLSEEGHTHALFVDPINSPTHLYNSVFSVEQIEEGI